MSTHIKQMLTGNSILYQENIWLELRSFIDLNEIVRELVLLWRTTRAMVVVPLLRMATLLCLVMTAMILIEKVCFGMVSLIVKIFQLKPEKKYKWEPIWPDLELGSLAYPKILIQIPMFNEKEVYKLSIGAACILEWPSDRLIIQVLDDSTDAILRSMRTPRAGDWELEVALVQARWKFVNADERVITRIQEMSLNQMQMSVSLESVSLECHKWRTKGVDIDYVVRDNRKGYKAGALHEGMKKDYVQECDYVAMFDADFQPDSDYLKQTIPFLAYNPEVALVQARWKFVNADECVITRIQEMSLNYHFKIEQEAGSSTFAFFGFNGTAGVWRISAIHDAGGWNDRTTVEDMDLSVRAGLKGWKFIYVGDIKVKNELPSTFKAYRFQQHRWSCGPANLFKKMAFEIITNKKVSLGKKFYVLYSFFFVGKIVAHTVTFIFYCLIIPISVFVPEVEIPYWGAVYVPALITLCKSVATPSSFHLIVIWVLFENVMSFHRLKAAITGLLEARRVNEWIVTEKLGGANKPKANTKEKIDAVEFENCEAIAMPLIEKPKNKPKPSKLWHRIYMQEIGLGMMLLICGVYDAVTARRGYFIYLFLQGITFLVMGYGHVGTYVPGA